VTIDEFPVGATPTGIAAGPDGNLYVTTTAPSILRVSPAGAVTARYPLDATGAPVAGDPVFATDGALWFSLSSASAGTAAIGRRASSGTTYTTLPTPSTVVGAMAPGADGSMMVADAQGVEHVAAQGVVAPVVTSLEALSDIAATPDGGWWFTSAKTWIDDDDAVVGGLDTAPPGDHANQIAAAPGQSRVWLGVNQRQQIVGFAATVSHLWSHDFATGLRIEGDDESLSGGILTGLATGPDGGAWSTYANAHVIGHVTPSGHATAYAQGLLLTSLPPEIAPGPGATVWFIDVGDQVGRITLDPPAVLTGAASAVTGSGATVAASAQPNGVASTVRFEYGPTAAYGATTSSQPAGDGDGPVAMAARLAGLVPGGVYHYRAVIENAFGTARGEDRQLTTVPPPPPPKPAPPDADGDGYPSDVDCDDASARTHPGATDVPGDHIDQDCSGTDAAYPRFYPRILAYFVTNHQRYSRFTELKIKALPATARVDLRCAGDGCAFKHWTTVIRRAAPLTDILPRVKGSKLRRGARLRLRLTLKGHLGTLVIWKVGPPPKPTVSCLRPGTTKGIKC
jgi:hypothetical protein